ncbi:MAG: hypothetical protein K2M19_09445 [Muribaculaceae bacterium]|nr:hypothetical protein [Muribaculaceae bacterium]
MENNRNKPEIRHRRLHAFYQSKVLNALMIVAIVSLLLMFYTRLMLLPVICGSLALLLFIGYSLWLWIKKPKSIMINEWLSTFSGLFTLYFLIVGAVDSENEWWYIVPVSVSVIVLFITLINNKDERFDI